LKLQSPDDRNLASYFSASAIRKFITTYAVTELDFTNLTNAGSVSELVQFFGSKYPGKLHSLTCTLSSSLVSLFQRDKTNFSNLRRLKALPADFLHGTPKYAFLIAESLRASLSVLEFPSDVSLTDAIVSNPADIKPLNPIRQFNVEPQSVPYHIVKSTMQGGYLANITSMSASLIESNGILLPFLLSLPKLQHAHIAFDQHSYVPATSLSLLRSCLPDILQTIQSNNKLRTLSVRLFRDNGPFAAHFPITKEAFIALGSSLEEFRLDVVGTWFDHPFSATADDWVAIFSSWKQIKRLSLNLHGFCQQERMTPQEFINALALNHSPSLEYLAFSSPTPGYELIILRDSLRAGVICRGHNVLSRGADPQPEPARADTHDDWARALVGRPWDESKVIQKVKLPDDASAPAICPRCQLFLPEHDLEGHSIVCPRRLLSCYNAGFGCRELFSSREEREVHSAHACVFWIVLCPYCIQGMPIRDYHNHMNEHSNSFELADAKGRSMCLLRNSTCTNASHHSHVSCDRNIIICPDCSTEEMPLRDLESHRRTCVRSTRQPSAAFLAELKQKIK
jgi:hypothetical protein